MKIYVVRGLGAWNGDTWASTNFEVTMLHRVSEDGSDWKPEHESRELLCYSGFQSLTGLNINPGEYIEVELKEVN